MKNYGFTLIEVLVTLAIVAMFSSAVYAVFLRSAVDARSVQESTTAWRTLLDGLHHRFEAAGEDAGDSNS